MSDRPLYLAAAWGVLGFAALLFRAIWQLAPLAIEPICDRSLSGPQGIAYLAWVAFMAYTEGYRTFHLQLAPRLVARGLYLAHHPRPLHVALAPFFCMGLLHATRRRLVISWSVLAGIAVLVIAVRYLEQPWRGIIDGGVVVGLGWGLVAILVYFVFGLRGAVMPVAAELPGQAAERA